MTLAVLPPIWSARGSADPEVFCLTTNARRMGLVERHHGGPLRWFWVHRTVQPPLSGCGAPCGSIGRRAIRPSAPAPPRSRGPSGARPVHVHDPSQAGRHARTLRGRSCSWSCARSSFPLLSWTLRQIRRGSPCPRPTQDRVPMSRLVPGAYAALAFSAFLRGRHPKQGGGGQTWRSGVFRSKAIVTIDLVF